jgi:hypothetical protein
VETPLTATASAGNQNSEGNLSGYLDIAVDLKERLEVLKKSRSLFLIGAAVLILAGISAIILFCGKAGYQRGIPAYQEENTGIYALADSAAASGVHDLFLSYIERPIYRNIQ